MESLKNDNSLKRKANFNLEVESVNLKKEGEISSKKIKKLD